MSNKVYIASSLDGYIADKNGGIDWLNMIPMTQEVQVIFADFMDSVDALVMGRNTFETVKGFGGEWPYSKRVFVVSNSMNAIPDNYKNKVELIKGTPVEIVSKVLLHRSNLSNTQKYPGKIGDAEAMRRSGNLHGQYRD